MALRLGHIGVKCRKNSMLMDFWNRSIILKFSYAHQDASMESTSNEGKGVYLHTLVDRERKRSNERG